MREKGIEREQAMDSVRLQRLIDVCDTKENTALYLLQEWNYEPQVKRQMLHFSKFHFLQTSIVFAVKLYFQYSMGHVLISPPPPPRPTPHSLFKLFFRVVSAFFPCVPCNRPDNVRLRAFYFVCPCKERQKLARPLSCSL